MINFEKKYSALFKEDTQLDLFGGDIPTRREVHYATEFCNTLDEYRRSVDVYNDDNEDLSLISYKIIYDGIKKYRPYITGEALETLDILEKSVKSHLPYFRETIIINNYITQATDVAKAKKEHDKRMRKKQPSSKTYEALAENYFKSFMESEELKSLPASAQKLSLYSHSLNIVDCLPSPKYSRTYKYRLKCYLNQGIVNMCDKLGPNYAMAKISAQREVEKFVNAMHNAKRKLEEQNTQKGFEARQRRLRDEYRYK
jgi:hypothetical protein